jgi:hypothetical protein
MTEPNEEEVRRLLAGMAAEAPGPDERAPQIARKARRRMAFTGTATALGLVVALSAGAVALPRFLDRNRVPVSAPTTPAPAPTATRTTVFGAPPEGYLVLDGTVYWFDRGHLKALGSVPERQLHGAATTPHGVLLSAGPVAGGSLWLIREDTEPQRLADDVQLDIAVSGDGELVAYGRIADQSSSSSASMSIRILRIADGAVVADSPPIRIYAGPDAFVGGAVLASTGDGGEASHQLWDPATGVIRDWGWYDEGVLDAYPRDRRLAVWLGCVNLVRVPEDGTPPELKGPCAETSNGQTWARFDGTGDRVAVMADPDGDGTADELTVSRFQDGSTIRRFRIDRGIQLVWESPSAVLVLGRGPGAGYTIWRCLLAGTGPGLADRCQVAWYGGDGVSPEAIALLGPDA